MALSVARASSSDLGLQDRESVEEFGEALVVVRISVFIATIPREIDEAAIIDGAGPLRLFFKVIFPLLRSVTITVIVNPVGVRVQRLHDPLYFLPGDENATVQLTLFNYQSQFNTQYHLLFADIL